MREQIKLTEIKISVNQRFVQHKNLNGQKIKEALAVYLKHIRIIYQINREKK